MIESTLSISLTALLHRSRAVPAIDHLAANVAFTRSN
jgi:hypothetical protein